MLLQPRFSVLPPTSGVDGGRAGGEESDSVFPKNTLLHPPTLQAAPEGEGKNWLLVSDSWILPFSL